MCTERQSIVMLRILCFLCLNLSWISKLFSTQLIQGVVYFTGHYCSYPFLSSVFFSTITLSCSGQDIPIPQPFVLPTPFISVFYKDWLHFKPNNAKEKDTQTMKFNLVPRMRLTLFSVCTTITKQILVHLHPKQKCQTNIVNFIDHEKF